MSRKSKGECTCKIVAQNERGMLGQVRDSVYRGVKYCGDGIPASESLATLRA